MEGRKIGEMGKEKKILEGRKEREKKREMGVRKTVERKEDEERKG